MPRRRRITDLQESCCHDCGSPLTWTPVSDVLVGTGADSDREVSEVPARVWETACTACGQTYVTGSELAARLRSP